MCLADPETVLGAIAEEDTSSEDFREGPGDKKKEETQEMALVFGT